MIWGALFLTVEIYTSLVEIYTKVLIFMDAKI